MNSSNQIEYWIKASKLDWETASDLFFSGKNYHFCLFLCHLAIEKLLKALVIKETDRHPPIIEVS